LVATLSAGFDPVIDVWDLRAGRKTHQFRTQRGVCCVAFAPDGRSLAAGGGETTILLWDVSRSTQPVVPPNLSPQEVDALWSDLANADAAKAYRAVHALTVSPRPALALLRAKLKPIETDATVRRLVADLDSEQFAVRSKATAQLEKLGDQAESALLEATAGRPSLEVRRRVEQLLAKLDRQALSPQMIQRVRAVEILELLDSSESRQLLESLAGGQQYARQTREAKAALQRMSGRVK
jgi:hypothetical protein